jgi:energy-coupling factor transport system substrate-specific component
VSWQLASFVILALALAGGVAWYERARPPARVVALVATLAALAALGRIAFAPLPSVKPTTDIVLISGYALGGAPGAAVGAVAALASNLFFGQGPYTPWQMLAWSLVGAGGAGLARLTSGRLAGGGRRATAVLAAACAVAGLAFGALMDFSTWLTYAEGREASQLAAISARGIPFNVAHAAGNVVFCLAFGPLLLRALTRFRIRLEPRWLPAAAPRSAAGVAGAVVALAVVAALGSGAPAAAARPDRASLQRVSGYLAAAQNADGGFGAQRGAASSQLFTAWASYGLAAAGRSPAAPGSGGRSALDFVRSGLDDVRSTADLERTILAIAAGGESPRRFGGRDLVADLLARRRRDGSFGGLVNVTAFAVLALRAAGEPASRGAVRSAASWIVRQANRDGGFSFFRRGGRSGIDDTAAAVQALAAAGHRRARIVRRAVAFLRRHQRRDGGFPLTPGDSSNAQSTAWAVQAFVAARRDPATVRRRRGRSPLRYLRSLVARDGAVRYSRASRQTPVWVTAQAACAFALAPLPVRPAAPASGASARDASAPRAAGALLALLLGALRVR